MSTRVRQYSLSLQGLRSEWIQFFESVHWKDSHSVKLVWEIIHASGWLKHSNCKRGLQERSMYYVVRVRNMVNEPLK